MDVKDKGGDKFLITPDLRKGTITLFKGPDDQLMHFCWKERPGGNVVDVSPVPSGPVPSSQPTEGSQLLDCCSSSARVECYC